MEREILQDEFRWAWTFREIHRIGSEAMGSPGNVATNMVGRSPLVSDSLGRKWWLTYEIMKEGYLKVSLHFDTIPCQFKLALDTFDAAGKRNPVLSGGTPALVSVANDMFSPNDSTGSIARAPGGQCFLMLAYQQLDGWQDNFRIHVALVFQ